MLCGGTIRLFTKRRGENDKRASDLADNVDKNKDVSHDLRGGTVSSTDPGYDVEHSDADDDDSLDSPLICATRMDSVNFSTTTLVHRRSLHPCDK